MGKTPSGDEAQTRQTNFGRDQFNIEKSNFVLPANTAGRSQVWSVQDIPILAEKNITQTSGSGKKLSLLSPPPSTLMFGPECPFPSLLLVFEQLLGSNIDVCTSALFAG